MRSGSGWLVTPVNAKPSNEVRRVFERNHAGEHAAVELGQHDMHGKVGGAEAARAVGPGGALGGGDDGLQHRNAGLVERRRIVGAAGRGEGRRGDDQCRRKPWHGRAQEGRRLRILQARDEQRRRRQAARGQRIAERVDRRDVGGEQHRPIEHDRDDGPALRQRIHQAIEIDRLPRRRIAAGSRHRPGLGAIERRARVLREPAQQRAEIVAPAFAEIAKQRRKLIRRQCRDVRETRIVAVLAGQHRERDAALAGQRREPVDAVAPPVHAAEQANDDHLGVAGDALDPQIDRHRMLEIAQLHEPHARQRVALDGPGGREPRQIAVGERKNGDIAGRLTEIDRLNDVVEAG